MMPSFWRPEQGKPWHDDVTMEGFGGGPGSFEAKNKSNDSDEPLLRILRSLGLTVVALARHDVINIKSVMYALGISWRQNNKKNTRLDRYM